ncbi:MAG TPA: hypothetical protein VGI85_14920 [Chthoniobacterales bacterium]
MASLARTAAIVRADFRIRFRRLSTVIVFLLLSAFAYVWVPAPSTGRALVQINGHRALNTSGTVGLGTASIGMIFVGLFGFYVISNTIRRDITTRCGLVAASTPMRSWEYLLGKFLGNLAFLSTFLGGFLFSSMAMLLVRGEGPFQPLVFIEQYLLLTPPAIVFVSAVAVLFESIPWLAGKFGDVVYFFLWASVVGLVIGNEASHSQINWTRCFDFTGFGFMIERMQQTLHTDSLEIGSSPFDPTKAPIYFSGLTMTRAWILPRLVSLLAPLALLPVAGLLFHRFDPVRIRRATSKGARNWIGKLQNLLKPLSRRAVFLDAIGGDSLGNAIWVDTIVTFKLYPLTLVAFIALTIATLFAPLGKVLPIVFAVLAVVLADVATRDGRAGTTASLRSVARLRESYVGWKLGSTFLLSLLFCAVAIVRIIPQGGLPLLALLCGIFFVAATATALGVMTANAKTFIVCFLSFWYLVVNDRGTTPMWDFAGFYGRANMATIGGYAAVSVLAVAAAQTFYRARLTRT